jgi:enoyl-CoA hydratase
MNYLVFETKGSGNNIGVLSINRPAALNALNSDVIAELDECLAGLLTKGLRCLIITGAGEKAFVAGADIAAMRTMSPEQAKAFSMAGNKVMRAIETFPCPVIAAVNGYALGGGLELALACDFRFASSRASFALPETSLGILPGFGGVERLTRVIGAGLAKEMVFSTERIKADEALRIHLVNRVLEPEALMAETLAMAEKIAANAPIGIAGAKRVANRSQGLSLDEAVDLECSDFAACFGSADQQEAMAAFVEKRQHSPFTGK